MAAIDMLAALSQFGDEDQQMAEEVAAMQQDSESSDVDEAATTASWGRASSAVGQVKNVIQVETGRPQAETMKARLYKITTSSLRVEGAPEQFVPAERLRDGLSPQDMDVVTLNGQCYYGLLGKSSQQDYMTVTPRRPRSTDWRSPSTPTT